MMQAEFKQKKLKQLKDKMSMMQPVYSWKR